ncbi:uncharacterized protein [Notothenia coriiceps]|uniref:SEA domain-containing protein n=1 Tax=Notothenia coriiceps TaxID=8208 RepID=A0A6I9PMF2_9TELE|nr:PREDICTED: uncharacterized protein LOC104961696 [Notothenia coriiceps]
MDHQKLVPHQDQGGQQLLEVQQQQAIQQLLEVQQQQAIQQFLEVQQQQAIQQLLEVQQQQCDLIFRERFQPIFIRTFVIEFRPITGGVQVEVGLLFSGTVPPAELVGETLIIAVNDPKNIYSCFLDENSIAVISPVVPTTTTGPMTTGFTLASSQVVVLTATLEKPFVKELKNRTSEQYRELERQVVTTCDLIFRERFWLIFIRTFVIEFRPIKGKVEIEVGLEFNTTTDQNPSSRCGCRYHNGSLE